MKIKEIKNRCGKRRGCSLVYYILPYAYFIPKVKSIKKTNKKEQCLVLK